MCVDICVNMCISIYMCVENHLISVLKSVTYGRMNIFCHYIVIYSNKDLLYTQNILSKFRTIQTAINFLLVDIILKHLSALLLPFLQEKTL